MFMTLVRAMKHTEHFEGDNPTRAEPCAPETDCLRAPRLRINQVQAIPCEV